MAALNLSLANHPLRLDHCASHGLVRFVAAMRLGQGSPWPARNHRASGAYKAPARLIASPGLLQPSRVIAADDSTHTGHRRGAAKEDRRPPRRPPAVAGG